MSALVLSAMNDLTRLPSAATERLRDLALGDLLDLARVRATTPPRAALMRDELTGREFYVPLPGSPGTPGEVPREPGRLVVRDGMIRYLPGDPVAPPLLGPFSEAQWDSMWAGLSLDPADSAEEETMLTIPPEQVPEGCHLSPTGLPVKDVVAMTAGGGRYLRVARLLYECCGCGVRGGLGYLMAHHRCQKAEAD